MKKLTELKTSPTPWTHKLDNGAEWNTVWDAMNGEVLSGGYAESVADARLIAAAPKLYDAAERYVRYHEESCIHGNRSASEIIADANRAFRDLKAALAEAAGESEVGK